VFPNFFSSYRAVKLVPYLRHRQVIKLSIDTSVYKSEIFRIDVALIRLVPLVQDPKMFHLKKRLISTQTQRPLSGIEKYPMKLRLSVLLMLSKRILLV